MDLISLNAFILLKKPSKYTKVIKNFKEYKMKRQILVSLAGLFLALSLMITGCKSDDGSGGIIDDPAAGSMTEETGRAIFEYDVDSGLGGVVIKKFISEGALKAYLTPSAKLVGDIKLSNLVLKMINGYNIVKIDTGAFTPIVDEITGNILADISTIIEAINLPETITEIAADAFSGIAESLTVQVPETVKEAIDEDVLQKIEDDIGNEVETYVPESGPNNDPNDNDSRLIGTWEDTTPPIDIFIFTATELTMQWITSVGGEVRVTYQGIYRTSNDVLYLDEDGDGVCEEKIGTYTFPNEDMLVFDLAPDSPFYRKK
jgi:hypothetical protein